MVSPADIKLSESNAFKKSKKITPKEIKAEKKINLKNILIVKNSAKNKGMKKDKS